jgi:hypothetical protein
MYRDGYERWTLATGVKEGALVWLNYVRLVPKDRTPRTIHTYPKLAQSLASPDQKSLIMQPDASQPVFRLVDISNTEPSGKDISLPAAVIGDLAGKTAHYTLQQWDESGRYVLAWQNVESAKDLIVIDTRNPERSVNVSREFSLPFGDAKFSGRSGNVLYAVSEGGLRKIDISGGTISRSLVDAITSFSVYDSSTITYTSSRTDEAGNVVQQAGVYREGDATPTVLASSKDADAHFSIATASYYNTTYTVIANGTKLAVYKGHYDQGMDGLSLVTERTTEEPIEHVEFNSIGSYVLVRAGKSFASYSIERGVYSERTLAAGAANELFWLDDMHLGLIAEGAVTMRDVDGTNIFSLMPARANSAVTLSRNGTYLYGVAEGKDGTSELRRIRMIL